MSILPQELLNKAAAEHPNPGLCSYSGDVSSGDIFIALGDGVKYIRQALDKGAVYVVCQQGHNLPDNIVESDRIVQVDQPEAYVNDLLPLVYGKVVSEVDLVGITGTNGKTSSAYFCSQLFGFLGIKAGYIGTLGYGIVGEALSASRNTTPDRITLYRYIAQLRNQGCSKIVLEVSSHAISLGRIHGLEFDVGAFTNLSRDHLDFHKTMQAYEEAKLSFFTDYRMNSLVVNLDDVVGKKLYTQQMKSHARRVAGYSRERQQPGNMYRYWYDAEAGALCIEYLGDIYRLPLSTRGQFNIQNMQTAVVICHVSGCSLNDIANVSGQIEAVPGRLEYITVPAGPGVYIDYAHTPDGMSAILGDATLMTPDAGESWCLFGCGGDRDVGKRPIMARTASVYADHVVIVDDNVRNEAAEKILCDMLDGVDEKSGLTICRDRKRAVDYVMREVDKKDVVFLLGKGDESTVDYGDNVIMQRDIDLIHGVC
jgi:UDP-N-acetylmuramoyl-L-alanyl-D-glutamate--2,6-diaminopimelate ligase